MQLKRLVGVVLIVVAAFCVTSAAAQAGQPQQGPRGQLAQYVAELRKSPSDALREKTIKLALTLDPKPAIPEDAVVAAAKGKTIFEHAAETGSKDDLKAAAGAFANASALAPWVPDYYFNQGSALEKGGQLDDAVRAFNFYLMAAPNAPDASDVRGRIQGILYDEGQEGKLCREMKDAKDSYYSQILAETSDEDTSVELIQKDPPSYGAVRLLFEDIGRQSSNNDVGIYGWTISCRPTASSGCAALKAHSTYEAQVNGGGVVSVKVGDQVVDFRGELYQGLFFPRPDWTEGVRKAWSRAMSGSCN